MPKSVIVVGAGIVGASLAWHLARQGAEVTVVDGAGAGGIATSHSFAWINASWGNPEFYVRFRRRSMAEWRRLAADVPAVGVEFCGGLIWDLPPDRLEAYAAEHAAWGYGIRRVDAAGALAIEPGLKQPPAFALHVAEEGMVDADSAARALLADAAIAVRREEVAELLTSGDRIIGVRLGSGPLMAEEVVVAAGAATAALLATAGVTIAMSDPAGLIAHSVPADRKLLNGLVMGPDFHVRQTGAGRLIVGSDFAGSDPGDMGEQVAGGLMQAVREGIRGAEHLALEFFTVGRRPTPADGYPLVGRAPGREGLYVAVMHSGVTLAPVVGLLGAAEIMDGRRDPLLDPYRLDRAPIPSPDFT